MKAHECFSETSVLLGCSKSPPDPADGHPDFNFHNFFIFKTTLNKLHYEVLSTESETYVIFDSCGFAECC